MNEVVNTQTTPETIKTLEQLMEEMAALTPDKAPSLVPEQTVIQTEEPAEQVV